MRAGVLDMQQKGSAPEGRGGRAFLECSAATHAASVGRPRITAQHLPLCPGAKRAGVSDCLTCQARNMCRGNFRSSWVAEGGDDHHVAEALFGELAVDGFFLEYDDARSGGFEPLRFVPKGNKRVVLGLVTSKRAALESKDHPKRRIEEAAKYVPTARTVSLRDPCLDSRRKTDTPDPPAPNGTPCPSAPSIAGLWRIPAPPETLRGSSDRLAEIAPSSRHRGKHRSPGSGGLGRAMRRIAARAPPVRCWAPPRP
jgi:hypothetical protein